MLRAVNTFAFIVPVPAAALDLLTRGGVVMWPLLALSVLGVTLVLERARRGGWPRPTARSTAPRCGTC